LEPLVPLLVAVPDAEAEPPRAIDPYFAARRVLAERGDQALLRRVAELGPAPPITLRVEDVEGHDVGRERVAREETPREQAIEQQTLVGRAVLSLGRRLVLFGLALVVPLIDLDLFIRRGRRP